MQPIELIGIDLLDEKEKELAQKLVTEYYLKIKRLSRNVVSLQIHIKEYKKEGSKKKYTINVKVDFPGGFVQANAMDWDFARTVHKVMNKVENEVERKFHSSEQHG